jgi:hypothetical protein
MMSPTIIPGDRVAVDRIVESDLELRPGEIVVVAVSRGTEHVRRIKSIEPSGALTVSTDSGALSDQRVEKHQITGRVLYLVYSIDPRTFQPRWSRFLRPVLPR